MDLTALKETLLENGQSHLLQFWDDVEPDQQQELYNDLCKINIPQVTQYFEKAMKANTTEKLDSRMQPIPEEQYSSSSHCTKEELQKYRQIGLDALREGKVAVLLLAGGQGTRLGVNYPKGMFDVELPSHKSLFQIQAERLQRIQQVAGVQNDHKVPWYIMTSEGTKGPTVQYFQSKDYFGLDEKNVIVFEQGMLPAFTFDGKIILENKHKMFKAPDGNGGLYQALHNEGILKDMKSRYIQYVHVYCVDNILLKMADPVFMGYCITKGADSGAKVVEKTIPTEQVGVFCKVDGKYQVVEYSEITTQTAELMNPKTGGLQFNAGNICNHFFTLDFLEKLLSGLEDTLVHHIAKKKIPTVDPNSGNTVTPKSQNGVKLEKFVFDVFQFSSKFAVWEVQRQYEFSPLKNSDTESKDTPTTCRNDLLFNNLQQLLNAGVTFNGKDNEVMDLNNNLPEVEISPLVSYDGENLEYIANNVIISSPLLIVKKGEKIRLTSTNNIKILEV
ncbi:UDP-N-acetylhexosamine pyrophosphorylase-like protein 1 [Folsomia candida]|nr:UDP-N-acetylhexosamine pyrophosphorylase-like protein 1 [Folsomia candida]